MKQTLFVVAAISLLSFTLCGCDDEVLPQKDNTIYVDSIAKNLTSIHDMRVGDSIQFYAYAFPKNAEDTTLIWSSDNSQIVSITSTGMAKAHRTGMEILCINAKKGGRGIGLVMRVSE